MTSNSSLRHGGILGFIRRALVTFALFAAAPTAAFAGNITVAWDANSEAEVLGYMLYVGTQAGAASESYDVGFVTSYTYGNAQPGVTYYFQVAAYAKGPLVGAKSAEVSAKTSDKPGVVTLLTPTGAQTGATPTFTWRPVAGATSYRLWADDPTRTGVAQGTYTAAQAGCADGVAICKASPNATFGVGESAWYVSAVNAAGNGPWSAPMTFTVQQSDTTKPSVTITTPTGDATFAAKAATLSLAGTASDNVGVTQVLWATDKGASGVATGTAAWSIPSVAVAAGTTVITVTARDAAGNTSTDTLTVTTTLVTSFANGGFEQGYIGWMSSGNQSVVVTNASYTASEGTRAVAFNTGGATPNGVLSQTFTTTPGSTYVLSFEAGAASFTNYSNQKMLVTVDGAANLLSKTVSLSAPKNGTNWVGESYSFVADSAETKLTFKDMSLVTKNVDLMLDHVEVEVR
jgi:hypothetical protein